MAGSQEQLTASLGCIEGAKNTQTQTSAGYVEPIDEINENSYCDWVRHNLRNIGRSALHMRPLFFSCSCFPLAIHLQSKGKTFQLSVPKYRSNLERLEWLHCEALKGSKEEKSRRVRGSWRLVTPVHWLLDVKKNELGTPSFRRPSRRFIGEGPACVVNPDAFSSIIVWLKRG